jgi:hypothetical protein
MINHRFVTLLLLAFLGFPLLSGSTNAVREGNEFSYLRNNLSRITLDNHQQVWNILNEVAERAKTCESVPYTADFIDLVRFFSGSSELVEFFGETIEHLCISNPTCFLDSLGRLDEKAKHKVVELLLHPLIVDEKEIREVFERYKEVQEYRDIIHLFFSRSLKE